MNFLDYVDTNYMVHLIIALIILCGFVIQVSRAYRHELKPFIDESRQFYSDWKGTPPRPGVPRQAGVLERLTRVETSLDSVKRDMIDAKADHEFIMNTLIEEKHE